LTRASISSFHRGAVEVAGTVVRVVAGGCNVGGPAVVPNGRNEHAETVAARASDAAHRPSRVHHRIVVTLPSTWDDRTVALSPVGSLGDEVSVARAGGTEGRPEGGPS